MLVVTVKPDHWVVTLIAEVVTRADIRWDVEGGDFVAKNTNPANGPIYIDVTWRRPYGAPHLGILDIASRQYGILNVFMYSVVCTAYPVAQVVLYGQTPSVLVTSSCTAVVGGGVATYQWQMLDVYSANNWADVAGATSATYQPPAFTAVWRMYRRITKIYVSGFLVQTLATTAANIKLVNLSGGKISATIYNIPYNTSPTTVSQIPAAGGYTAAGYTYSYTWEYMYNNGSW